MDRPSIKELCGWAYTTVFNKRGMVFAQIVIFTQAISTFLIKNDIVNLSKPKKKSSSNLF